MKTKKKSKKKTGIYTAKLKAWTAFSKYIRLRDIRCCTCSSGVAEHAGHFIHNTDKVNKILGGNELWYDERNVHGQCFSCNNMHSGRREVYALFLEKKYKHGILQELYKKYNTPKKWTLEELHTVKERFEALTNELTH